MVKNRISNHETSMLIMHRRIVAKILKNCAVRAKVNMLDHQDFCCLDKILALKKDGDISKDTEIDVPFYDSNQLDYWERLEHIVQQNEDIPIKMLIDILISLEEVKSKKL